MSFNNDSGVQHAVPASSIQSSIPKSTITKRNTKAKKGLGAKKVGGLSGKKLTKAEFEKLEKGAEEEDQLKRRLSMSSDGSALTKNDEPSNGESLRLAYQDLTIQQKQNELKLSKMNDTKKEQALRLGMGMGKTEGVAHSLSMQTIDQVDPQKRSGKGRYRNGNDIFYDSSSKTRRNRGYLWDQSDSDDNDDDFFSKNDFSYSESTKSSKKPPSYTITPIASGHTADTTIFKSAKVDEPKNSRQRSSKPNQDSSESFSDKYKGAKAISSDMVFGSDRQMSSEESFRKFDGRSAISSEDYYPGSTSRSNQRGQMDGIKDGVREGVRSVAGKLSNIASDLASTLQDRYG